MNADQDAHGHEAFTPAPGGAAPSARISERDQDLLLRALDGDLSAAEDAQLAARLAAEPDLARELVLLSRQESLLHDAVAAAPAAIPMAEPVQPRFSRGGLMTMAASLLLFGGVLAAIVMPAPVATPAQSGQDVPSLIDKLRSADIAERDAAVAELKKLPVDKLPLLEKALASDDAEVAGKTREAVAAVLGGAFSRKVAAGEFRAVADFKVMKQWQKDGQVPEGYEVMEYFSPLAPKPESLLVRTQPVMAVKAESVKLQEGKGGNAPALTSAGGGTAIEFELTADGDKAFAEIAGKQTYLSVVVMSEGKIHHRTSITQRPGAATRMAFMRAKDEAQRFADLMTGKLVEIGFGAAPERNDAAAPEAASAAVKKAIEKADVAIDGKKLVIRIPVDVKSPDLVAAWTALRSAGWKMESK